MSHEVTIYEVTIYEMVTHHIRMICIPPYPQR